MINRFYSNKFDVFLTRKKDVIPEKNIFTVLVGKNGTGKSTLLGELCQSMISEVSNYRDQGLISFYKDEIPDEIISISISPFDKFPMNKYERLKKYTYLGLRDINSSFLGFGYLSKIINSLLVSILHNTKQAFDIGNILNYLGYHDKILLQFNFAFQIAAIDDFRFSDNNVIQDFDDRSNFFFKRINKSFFLNSDDSINERKLNKLKKMLSELENKYYFRRFFEVLITRYGFESIKSNEDIEDIIFLLNSGVIKLKDVHLFSVYDDKNFSIKDASSGEQSIILSILGIASKIKDKSLICIDEPEICLHPEWQEKYIELLAETFSSYKSCHFIIATHSPLIISRLPQYNSFILNMENKKTESAKNYVNHSADYQLAHVFDFPGYKNEYLTRIAINTFSKISKYKKLDDEDKVNIEILESQSKYLRPDDPVYDLYKTLKELRNIF